MASRHFSLISRKPLFVEFHVAGLMRLGGHYYSSHIPPLRERWVDTAFPPL
jgi:hypothetical protein